MNIQNLTKLRDHLASIPAPLLRMESYFIHDYSCSTLASIPEEDRCGTPACIAGHAQLIGAETEEDRRRCAGDFAQDWLDLDCYEADHLFCGDFTETPLGRITRAEVLAEIDRMLATPR